MSCMLMQKRLMMTYFDEATSERTSMLCSNEVGIRVQYYCKAADKDRASGCQQESQNKRQTRVSSSCAALIGKDHSRGGEEGIGRGV